MLHFEDFKPGQVFECGSVQPSREEIIAFAEAFDPQPFHLDEEAGRATPFGGLVASGWHTCALFMRMMVDGLLSKAASLGSPGLDELRWLRPVRPGQRLSGRVTIMEVKPSTSKPDRGAVLTLSEMFDDDGQPVLQMKSWLMLRRRPAAA